MRKPGPAYGEHHESDHGEDSMERRLAALAETAQALQAQVAELKKKHHKGAKGVRCACLSTVPARRQ